jgi:hypothetical protein
MVHNVLDGKGVALLTHVAVLHQDFFDFNMMIKFDTDIDEFYLLKSVP